MTLQRLLMVSLLILCWLFIIAAGLSLAQEIGLLHLHAPGQ